LLDFDKDLAIKKFEQFKKNLKFQKTVSNLKKKLSNFLLNFFIKNK
jgi:hypothetical protein